MDENEVMQTEAADEEVEVEEAEPEVEEQDTTGTDPWDDDWDDLLDEKFDTDEDDEDDDQTDGHQKEDDHADEESDTDDDTKAEPSEDKPEEKAEAKLFHLKHLNEEVDVDEAEVIKLAQKGMDYDFIRGEHDRLKAENARYKEYDAFLTELAANSEQTVDELMDSTRARLLVANERKEGRTMGEAEAFQRVQRQRAERAKAPAQQVAPKQEQEPQMTEEQKRMATQQKVVQDFVKAFPDLDPKTIPKDIFMKGLQDGDLVTATNKWLNDERDKELAKLRSENEKLKQHQKNKARSTGSMKSSGVAKRKDAYDVGWYDDD